MKPLKDNVLIEFEEGKDISQKGIILIHKEEEKPRIANVIEVGNKVEQVKKGDRVIVGRYVGNQLKYNNKEYILLKEKDILAKIEE